MNQDQKNKVNVWRSPLEMYKDFVGWYPEDGSLEAMQEFADQETAAKDRQIADLEMQVNTSIKLAHEMAQKVLDLEQDTGDLTVQTTSLSIDLNDAKQLNEKLIGLLKEQYINRNIYYLLSKGYIYERAKSIAADGWESYCRERNLNFDKNGK